MAVQKSTWFEELAPQFIKKNNTAFKVILKNPMISSKIPIY